ncbi:hypothetical protein BN946_scf184943.g43 [Trametes cinnabarina]|uniref:Uncharacterized protein n=1 Tax=Pycnoporus cinnabarinus TaxID=5643 RepID=A0A060SHU9_PYCCI|nr:hypothetical protein BN946_scf184943.g43 [Trametes cinnabarina]
MSSSLTAARMSYGAALVAGVTYGLYVAIAAYAAMQVLRTKGNWKGPRMVLLSWITVMFMIQTIYFVAGSKWSEIEFVESTENPGVFASELSSRLSILKDTCYTVVIWLADGFILYRAVIIYTGQLYFVILPALLYLASIATGIGLLVETAKPGAMFGQTPIIDFGTPFWSISVAMNVLTTLLIAARLVYRRKIFYPTDNKHPRYPAYGPEVAIFLESAALYAICSIIYIPMFVKNIPLQFPFSALLGSAASIAPHFIIIRMANGQSQHMERSLISLQERGLQSTNAGQQRQESVVSEVITLSFYSLLCPANPCSGQNHHDDSQHSLDDKLRV